MRQQETVGQQPGFIPARKYITRLSMVCMGILASLDGVYYGWNGGLHLGIGNFIVTTILIGVAYMCYYCCLSELTSTLPFPGGSYGFARCSIGFYGGYLVGCFEILYYVMLTALSNASVLEIILLAFPEVEMYAPLFMLFIFIAEAIICSFNSLFWKIIRIMAFLSIFILIFYCIDAISVSDFPKYAVLHNLKSFHDRGIFHGSIGEFFAHFPYAVYFFIGNELANLLCDEVEDPRTDVPVAQLSVGFLLFFFSIIVPFATVSSPPGIEAVSKLDFPLEYGSPHLRGRLYGFAVAFSLSGATCLMYAYGKLIAAMADSALFPRQLSYRLPTNNVPIAGIIAGSCIGLISFTVCLSNLSYFNYWPFLIGIFSCLTNCLQLIGFISIRTKLLNLTRKFRSPMGVIGAIYSLCTFATILVSGLFLHGRAGALLIVLLVVFIIISMIYFFYSRKRQIFSAEENRFLLIAHAEMLNANEYYYSQFAYIRSIMMYFNIVPHSRQRATSQAKSGKVVPDASSSGGQKAENANPEQRQEHGVQQELQSCANNCSLEYVNYSTGVIIDQLVSEGDDVQYQPALQGQLQNQQLHEQRPRMYESSIEPHASERPVSLAPVAAILATTDSSETSSANHTAGRFRNQREMPSTESSAYEDALFILP